MYIRLEMTDYRVLLISIVMFSGVVCEDCVTFDFEKDFNSSFSNEIGVCGGLMVMWRVGRYEDLPIEGPDEGSSKFVYPTEDLSCASSFTFRMSAAGVLEINLFIQPTSVTDQVTVLANQVVPNGQDVVVGNDWVIASDEDFVSGWRTMRINLSGFGTYTGYVSLKSHSFIPFTTRIYFLLRLPASMSFCFH